MYIHFCNHHKGNYYTLDTPKMLVMILPKSMNPFRGILNYVRDVPDPVGVKPVKVLPLPVKYILIVACSFDVDTIPLMVLFKAVMKF